MRGKLPKKYSLGLSADDSPCSFHRFSMRVSERAMNNKTLVLGLLLACIANVICLAGYL